MGLRTDFKQKNAAPRECAGGSCFFSLFSNEIFLIWSAYNRSREAVLAYLDRLQNVATS